MYGHRVLHLSWLNKIQVEKMVRLGRVKEQRVKLAKKNLSIRYVTRQHRGACVCKVLTNWTSRLMVKQKVYQKIDLVETHKAQNIGSVETTTTFRKQPMRKAKAAQHSKPSSRGQAPCCSTLLSETALEVRGWLQFLETDEAVAAKLAKSRTLTSFWKQISYDASKNHQ